MVPPPCSGALTTVSGLGVDVALTVMALSVATGAGSSSTIATALPRVLLRGRTVYEEGSRIGVGGQGQGHERIVLDAPLALAPEAKSAALLGHGRKSPVFRKVIRLAVAAASGRALHRGFELRRLHHEGRGSGPRRWPVVPQGNDPGSDIGRLERSVAPDGGDENLHIAPGEPGLLRQGRILVHNDFSLIRESAEAVA